MIIDLPAIKARAAARLALAAMRQSAPIDVGSVANPASRLVDGAAVTAVEAVGRPGVSQLAALAADASRSRPYAPLRDDLAAAHAAPWDDAAIARFEARQTAFLRRGYIEDDADDLALRLHVRDVDGDDRRACIECSFCGETGRCLAEIRGRRTNAGVELHQLHRCESFGLRKGLA